MIQLSTGDILRAAKDGGTEMGKVVAAVMARGDLVTDDVVIGLIRERIGSERGGGFIFDGFPRTLAQADALGDLLAEVGMELDCVIELQVDDTALIQRITARSSCGACGAVYNDITSPWPEDGRCSRCGSTDIRRRADDNEESLRQRLMEYYKKTSPLIGYYHAKGKLASVHGLGEINEVRYEISSALPE